MTHYYFDSSALVKRYVAEIGTAWVQSVCAPTAKHILYTVRVSGAEIVAALFRRARTGTLVLADAHTAAAQFKLDFQNEYQIAEITEALTLEAMRLAETHGLRGYDSLQLAAALSLQNLRASLALPSIIFVSADEALNQVAIAEGLQVDNPNQRL
jgi:hypothetical protein